MPVDGTIYVSSIFVAENCLSSRLGKQFAQTFMIACLFVEVALSIEEKPTREHANAPSHLQV